MSLIDHYIRKHVINATLVMVSVILAIESFLEFVGELSDIGIGHYGVLQALMYVPMQLPLQLYQLFPLAGFLGSLIGLGWLASSNELTVMRASGISVNQIGRSVVISAAIMIIFVTLIGEGFAPLLQQKSNAMKLQAMGHTIGVKSLNGIWLHQDNEFIDINNVISPTQIKNIYIFRFDAKNHLLSSMYAAQGDLQQHTWYLSNIATTTFTPKGLQKRRVAVAPYQLVFDPKLSYQTEQDPSSASIWTIVKSIVYSEHTGAITNSYVFAFWQRLIAPITSIVMICLGIPFIFGSLRTAPMGTRLLVGVVVGFVFYMMNQIFGPFTMVYQFPPFLAATLPTILFGLAYVLMLRYVH